LRVLKAAFTRWLSYDQVTSMLYNRFPEVLIALSRAKDSDAVSKGLLYAMSRVEFFASLLILRDVLPLFAELSRRFQSDDADVELMHMTLESTLKSVTDMLDTPGRNSSRSNI
jgi:hypothetical protein